MGVSPVNEGRSYKAEIFRGGKLHTATGEVTLATWNVEGLTDQKLVELRLHMKETEIGVLCLQETHKPRSDYLVLEDGLPLGFFWHVR